MPGLAGRRRRPAGPRAGCAPLPADVPVLVIGGDLDSLTPVSDAALVTGPLATRSRTVVVANTFHASSEGDTTCPATPLRPAPRARLRARARRARAARRRLRRHRPGPAHPSGYPSTLAAARPADVASGADPGVRCGKRSRWPPKPSGTPSSTAWAAACAAGR